MGNRSTGCGMVACNSSDYCGAWRAVIDSFALMQSQEITFNDVMEVSMKILPVLVVLTGARLCGRISTGFCGDFSSYEVMQQAVVRHEGCQQSSGG